MISTIIRYGIIALAAALATLSGREAAGGESSLGHHNARGTPNGRSKLLFAPRSPFRVPRFTLPAPPPGTLGRTYRQLSRPIPAQEHPRTGMLEVRGVPAGAHVTVNGMNGYRGTNGVWYFKTERPLIPCVPFIKTVRIQGPNCNPHAARNYRVIRLIPDRIVCLQW